MTVSFYGKTFFQELRGILSDIASLALHKPEEIEGKISHDYIKKTATVSVEVPLSSLADHKGFEANEEDVRNAKALRAMADMTESGKYPGNTMGFIHYWDKGSAPPSTVIIHRGGATDEDLFQHLAEKLGYKAPVVQMSPKEFAPVISDEQRERILEHFRSKKIDRQIMREAPKLEIDNQALTEAKQDSEWTTKPNPFAEEYTRYWQQEKNSLYSEMGIPPEYKKGEPSEPATSNELAIFDEKDDNGMYSGFFHAVKRTGIPPRAIWPEFMQQKDGMAKAEDAPPQLDGIAPSEQCAKKGDEPKQETWRDRPPLL